MNCEVLKNAFALGLPLRKLQRSKPDTSRVRRAMIPTATTILYPFPVQPSSIRSVVFLGRNPLCR